MSSLLSAEEMRKYYPTEEQISNEMRERKYFTIEQKLASLRRELALRKAVYPKQVERKAMKPEKAEMEIEIFESIIQDYENAFPIPKVIHCKDDWKTVMGFILK